MPLPVPPPPPPIEGPREVFPVSFGTDPRGVDFRPRVLPASVPDEEARVVEGPKGAGAISSALTNSVTQPVLPLEEERSLQTSPPDFPTALQEGQLPPALAAEIPSPVNSSPTGSVPTSSGKIGEPAPVPNIG